jgi:hypothetical protein
MDISGELEFIQTFVLPQRRGPVSKISLEFVTLAQ